MFYSFHSIRVAVLLALIGAGFVLSCATDSAIQGVEIDRIVDKIDGEPVVPREANTIYLNAIVNRSGRPGLSERLMLKIKDSINIDGRLAVTPVQGKSDLQLDFFISSYSVQNLEFSNIGIPVKKRLRVTAELRLRDNERNRNIFSGYTVQAFEEFSDQVPPIKSAIQVEEGVISELARRISLKTIQGWYSERLTEIERNK